jgi:hypothetical protein
MTPQCLDRLASLFNDFADDLIDDDEEIMSHFLAAIKAYQLVMKEAQAQ